MKKELLTVIQHIGIPTEDMAATREFYEKLGAHAMPWWVGYRAENEALIQLAGDKGEKNNGN